MSVNALEPFRGMNLLICRKAAPNWSNGRSNGGDFSQARWTSLHMLLCF